MSRPSHLIAVCCNTIYTGSASSNPYQEENWDLKPYQASSPTQEGEHKTYLAHIQAAVRTREQHPTGIIVFSGAATSSSYPTLSEAQSYLNALQALGTAKDEINKVLLDESATDSFQNVIFSIMSFRKHHGYYPSEITIVAHAFKKKRLLNLHAKAIRWPADRIRVLGIDPPFSRTSPSHYPFSSFLLRIHLHVFPTPAVAQALNITSEIDISPE
jgi:hypothetical protein